MDTACKRCCIPFALRDNYNRPIQNISITDLEGKVRGKPIKILSFAPDPRPHRLVLLLDTSGSMGSTAGESPQFALGLALARHFFDVNHQWSHIALLTFNKNVTETLDFTRGNSVVGDKLQQITSDHNYLKANVKGTTALRDAILEGLQLLDHPSSADALYLLTDGGDNASKHSATDDNLLEIEPPFLLAKNERWELRVSDAARRQRKGAQITYPMILISCNSEVSGVGRR